MRKGLMAQLELELGIRFRRSLCVSLCEGDSLCVCMRTCALYTLNQELTGSCGLTL